MYDSLVFVYICSSRDAGLKRTKVKDAFKEEEQQLYSKILMGGHEDQNRCKHTEGGCPEGDKDK